MSNGKSTLLDVLAGELPLQQGTLSFHPETTFAHFGQTNIQRLNLKNTIINEIMRLTPYRHARVRGICGGMMFKW